MAHGWSREKALRRASEGALLADVKSGEMKALMELHSVTLFHLSPLSVPHQHNSWPWEKVRNHLLWGE